LQPSVLLQFCGYGVWIVRTKTGRERPPEDWIIVPNAHAAPLTEEEAAKIAQARKVVATARQQFGSGVPPRSRSSPYLASGGLFRCESCGMNMIGFQTDSSTSYVYGSQPYRRGMGCGPGLYVPKRPAPGDRPSSRIRSARWSPRSIGDLHRPEILHPAG